jgi:hypothetical protein
MEIVAIGLSVRTLKEFVQQYKLLKGTSKFTRFACL